MFELSQTQSIQMKLMGEDNHAVGDFKAVVFNRGSVASLYGVHQLLFDLMLISMVN